MAASDRYADRFGDRATVYEVNWHLRILNGCFGAERRRGTEEPEADFSERSSSRLELPANIFCGD